MSYLEKSAPLNEKNAPFYRKIRVKGFFLIISIKGRIICDKWRFFGWPQYFFHEIFDLMDRYAYFDTWCTTIGQNKNILFFTWQIPISYKKICILQIHVCVPNML